jgi:hypothetical protein
MSRTPARFTQADVARTIRAAKQVGAEGVEVRPDGTIYIHLRQQPCGENRTRTPEKELEADDGAIL